ncbi:MAG: DUF3575 domain-containing protein [Rikenellaceae bacterium]
MKTKYWLIIILALFVCNANAQKIAIKSNLVYDAAATVNLGVEIGLGKRTTLDISGNYNAWYTDESQNEKMRHFLLQPEFRYYFCEKMSGHFIGAHAHILQFNVCGDQWLMNTFKAASSFGSIEQGDSRYQGDGYGGGFVYGYSWAVASRLNIEFAVGAGYLYLDYEKYGPSTCDPLIEVATSHYWGLTKLGVSLVYIIK